MITSFSVIGHSLLCSVVLDGSDEDDLAALGSQQE